MTHSTVTSAALCPIRSGRATPRRARFIAVASALLTATLLQGCGLSSITSGIGGGVLGGGSGATTKGVTEENMLTAAKSEGEVSGLGVTHGCPQVLINPRDKHLTFYESGRTGDGLAIIHQGELTKTARECSIETTGVTIKYGFSGRLLLGPKGQPGIVRLPFQVVITNAGRERLQTETLSLDVAIAPDNPIGYFSTVRSISLAVPEGARAGDFKLFVAFDKDAAEKPTAPQPAKPTKPARTPAKS